MAPRVLTINTGSSSVKAAVFELGSPVVAVASTEDPGFLTRPGALPTSALVAVAHRVVHGGSRFFDPQVLTDETLTELRRLVPIAPEHLPPALDAIDAARRAFPDSPQIACFDTAFHRHLPPEAQRLPLPMRPWMAEVRRYGFHGLSCEWVMDRLSVIDPARARGRLVIAHLGGGASLTAVRDVRSVETTMGFSPTGGIMMGTRTGDLDPGVLLYALDHGVDRSTLGRLLTHESGLRGVSERTADMRDLLSRESSDPRAAEAIALFCYLAKKSLGALIAVLGGIDTLVFTGGIGEHAAPIRARITAGLADLGIDVDADRNGAPVAAGSATPGAGVISSDQSRAIVLVIAADENRVLAMHAQSLLDHGSVRGAS